MILNITFSLLSTALEHYYNKLPLLPFFFTHLTDKSGAALSNVFKKHRETNLYTLKSMTALMTFMFGISDKKSKFTLHLICSKNGWSACVLSWWIDVLKWKKLIVILFLSLSSTSTCATDRRSYHRQKVVDFSQKYFKDLRNFTLETKVQEPENQVYLDSIEFSNWFRGDFNDDRIDRSLCPLGMEKKNLYQLYCLAADDDESLHWVHVSPTYRCWNFHIVVTEDYKTKPLVVL